MEKAIVESRPNQRRVICTACKKSAHNWCINRIAIERECWCDTCDQIKADVENDLAREDEKHDH